MSRPKFGALFRGKWPYEWDTGVGIQLRGKPTERMAFIQLLARYSCPIDIAHRHAQILFAAGELKTTVLSHLDFPALAADLKRMNISLRIIPPRGYKAP